MRAQFSSSGMLQQLLATILNCSHVVLYTPTLRVLQARWASAAAQVLRTWRHQIDISVPWRPLYDFLHASLRSSKASYEGEPA